MISLNLVEAFGTVEHQQRHTHSDYPHLNHTENPTLGCTEQIYLGNLPPGKSIYILLKLTGTFPPSNKPLTLSPDKKKKIAKPFKKKKL